MPKRLQHFEVTISDGKLKIKQKELLDFWLQDLGDGPAVLSIGRTTRLRSLAANRYMWGWQYEAIIEVIHKSSGWSKSDLHGWAKAKAKKFKEYNGKMYEIVPTTTTMDEKEFYDFLQATKQAAWEDFGVTVPLTLKEQMNQVEEWKPKKLK